MRRVWLEINAPKAKVMCIKITSDASLTIADKPFECVDSFRYLGNLISNSNVKSLHGSDLWQVVETDFQNIETFNSVSVGYFVFSGPGNGSTKSKKRRRNRHQLIYSRPSLIRNAPEFEN